MLIYVSSPYQATIREERERNFRFARWLCEIVLGMGHLPIASHVFYHQLLRNQTAYFNERALEAASLLVGVVDGFVYVGYTEGVKRELAAFCRMLGISDRYEEISVRVCRLDKEVPEAWIGLPDIEARYREAIRALVRKIGTIEPSKKQMSPV